MVIEITGNARNRRYRADEMIDVINAPQSLPEHKEETIQAFRLVCCV